MCNVYFTSFDQVLAYRGDRLALNMADIYRSSQLLSCMLKDEEDGLYRKGKSVPLIRQGDRVSVSINGVDEEKQYCGDVNELPENVDKNDYIDYEGICSLSCAVYDASSGREIIPAIKNTLRHELFSSEPVVPNIFIRAMTSVVSAIMEESINRDQIIDYSYNLPDLIKVDPLDKDKAREMALNYIYYNQIKEGKRKVVSDEEIEETAEKFISEYEALLDNIVKEVDDITNKSIRNFCYKGICNRYHFDEDGLFFYIERGLDTRIYEWEKIRFEKIEEIEENTGVKIQDMLLPKFSSLHDFL